jgi:hypothetical protein
VKLYQENTKYWSLQKWYLMKKMAAGVHRRLKVLAFNANGISRHRCELTKQLNDLHIDVTVLSETYRKPYDRFFIPDCQFYRTDRFPERKGQTTVAVRKGIPHNHVDLPPLVSIQATGVCILISNNEVLLAAVYISQQATPGMMQISLSS